MLRSINEIMDSAMKNALVYIPQYIEEKRHKKYAYKKNLKSKKDKK